MRPLPFFIFGPLNAFTLNFSVYFNGVFHELHPKYLDCNICRFYVPVSVGNRNPLAPIKKCATQKIANIIIKYCSRLRTFVSTLHNFSLKYKNKFLWTLGRFKTTDRWLSTRSGHYSSMKSNLILNSRIFVQSKLSVLHLTIFLPLATCFSAIHTIVAMTMKEQQFTSDLYYKIIIGLFTFILVSLELAAIYALFLLLYILCLRKSDKRIEATYIICGPWG